MATDTPTDGLDAFPSIQPIEDIQLPYMEIGEVSRGVLLHLALTNPVAATNALNRISEMFRQRFHGQGQMSPYVMLRDPFAADSADNQIRFYIHWKDPTVTIQLADGNLWDIREDRAYITDEQMPESIWMMLECKLPSMKILGDVMDLKLTSGAPRQPLTHKILGTRDTVQSGPGYVTKTIRQIMFEWKPRYFRWKRTHAALSRIIHANQKGLP